MIYLVKGDCFIELFSDCVIAVVILKSEPYNAVKANTVKVRSPSRKHATTNNSVVPALQVITKRNPVVHMRQQPFAARNKQLLVVNQLLSICAAWTQHSNRNQNQTRQ